MKNGHLETTVTVDDVQHEMVEKSRLDAAEARVRELTAENERLRHDNSFLSRELGRAQADADLERCERVQLEETDNSQFAAAEARLAAATALLGRIWEALGELTSYVVDGDHMVRVDQVRGVFEHFLANQPAAPVPVDGNGKPDPLRPLWDSLGQPAAYDAAIVFTGDHTQPTKYAQPAAPRCAQPSEHHESCDCETEAPARTEAVFEVQGRSWPAGTHPTRTEAEQAVLEAMSRIPHGHLSTIIIDGCPAAVDACRAELARRGLK